MAKTVGLSVKHYVANLLERLIEDDAIKKLASEYQIKYSDVTDAAKHFVKDHSKQATCIAIIEQATTFADIPELAGASAGFLGIVYYQLHIVCGIAAIAGKDIHSNEVKTQCMECLTVSAITRATRPVVAKVVAFVLKKYKFKGMEKVVNAALELLLDWGSIKLISNRAYKVFIGNTGRADKKKA